MNNAIKFDISPLEATNLFTLSHVNSKIRSYCDVGVNGEGKLVIELDIIKGISEFDGNGPKIVHGNISDPTDDTFLPTQVNRTNLPFIYNENIVKFNENGPTELIIKFKITNENTLNNDSILINIPVSSTLLSSQDETGNGNDPDQKLFGSKVPPDRAGIFI